MPNAAGFPQGDAILRKEDHSGLIDCYISRIENSDLQLKKKITKEELAANLPPRVDLSKMPL